jgi:hypothetical protein
VKPAAGHHDSLKAFIRAGVNHHPAGRVPSDQFDAGAEPDTGDEPERFGVAVQVAENLAVGQVDVVGCVLEVAEGRDGAAAVGVHARPHAAAAIQGRPLPTQHRSLLEDGRLKSLP